MSIVTRHAPNAPTFCQNVRNTATQCAVFTTGHVVAAWLFSVNPLTGAILGGVGCLIRNVARSNLATTNKAAKWAEWILIPLVSTAAGTLAANAMGYPIRFGTALIINLMTTPVLIAGGLCLVGIMVATAITIDMLGSHGATMLEKHGLAAQAKRLRGITDQIQPSTTPS
jgi:hypothetical protein